MIPIKIEGKKYDFKIGNKDKNGWEIIRRFLPIDLEEKAKEYKVLEKKRKFKTAENLIRVLLIHFLDSLSLRETCAKARIGNLVDISDVGLLKKIKNSKDWLNWIVQETIKNFLHIETEKIEIMNKYRIRIIDGTNISEPGSTGSDWRIHYSINLKSLSCDEVKVTDIKTGETFKNFTVEKNDILIGDRGYCHKNGVQHVLENGGHILVRMNTNLPIYNKKGDRKKLIDDFKNLKIGECQEWIGYIKTEKGEFIPGRICAIRKTSYQTEKARQKATSASRKKKHKIKEDTLAYAEYIYVFTTLPKEIDSSQVLELYRSRWQIELVFKKLKSLIGLGHIPKQNPDSAKAWLQGKLLAALLIECLLSAGNFFSPWGYPIRNYA